VLVCVAADVVLEADDKDGYDSEWGKRYEAGTNSWGIDGTGDPLSGKMWFNSFPGASGTYEVIMGIVAEEDGQPEYKVYAGGDLLKGGKYPCPGGSCDCSKNTRAQTINLGEHHIAQGDKIEVWGKSVYPCGSHGAYARWYELRFKPISVEPDPPSIELSTSSLSFSADAGYSSTPSSQTIDVSNGGGETLPSLNASESAEWLEVTVEGSGNSQSLKNEIVRTGLSADTYRTTVTVSGSDVSDVSYEVSFTVREVNTGTPTELVAPAEGAELEEGAAITLSGNGDNLAWSYDANSDGLSRIDIGNGEQVDFTIPTGINPPREITIFVSGDNGEVSRTYQIVDAAQPRELVTVLAPNGGETFTGGETLRIRWEADTTVVTDVDILLSTDGGQNWDKVNTDGSVSVTDQELWGDFSYLLPAATESQQCYVRVEKYETTDPDAMDLSDASFTIEPGVTAINPPAAARMRGALSVRLLAEGGLVVQAGVAGRYEAQVVDCRGAVIHSFTGAGRAPRIIPGVRLPAGLYLVRVTSGTRVRCATTFLVP
jgi:hypothetical protein